MVSRECTERQKESEKQAELCNVKVESNGLAVPDHLGKHTGDRSPTLQWPGVLMTLRSGQLALPANSVITSSQRETLDTWPCGFLML